MYTYGKLESFYVYDAYPPSFYVSLHANNQVLKFCNPIWCSHLLQALE